MLASQALIIGALQGISELFPVSSLAQTILIPALLKWDLGDPKKSDYLAFVVALHLATAIALLIYFWKDWKVVIDAFIGSAKRRTLVYDEASKIAWLLVAGTVVVGALGLAFERRLRELFENPQYAWIVAVVLILNGFIMLFADVLKRRASTASVNAPEQDQPQDAPPPAAAAGSDPAADATGQRKQIPELTFIEGASVGATQTFALIPGISRSGVTIVAGLLAGLSYEAAAKFSFMLATPVIGLAALLKVPKLLSHDARPFLPVAIAAAILAGITAYLSTKFLMRYFQNHRLGPFGWYCIIFGVFSLVMVRQ